MFFIYTRLKDYFFDRRNTVDSLDKATGKVKSIKTEYYSHKEKDEKDQPYPERAWATFNSKGKVIRTKSEHDYGWYQGGHTAQRGHEVEFIYDSNDMLLQKNIGFYETSHKSDFTPSIYNTETHTFIYNEKGDLSRINYGGLRTEIIYDDQQRIAEVHNYNREGVYEYTRYEYDELDRVIKIQEYGHFWDDESDEPKRDDIKLTYETLLEYDRVDDKTNRCIKKKSDIQYGYTTTKTYLFDDLLRIKKTSELNSKGLPLTAVVFEYTLDGHDNMMELFVTAFFGENKDTVRYSRYKRTIEYW